MNHRVAHVIWEYLGHTLNWVYSQIKYAPRYSPIVLTGKLMNQTIYPVEDIFLPRYRFPVLLDRLFLRMGRTPADLEWCFRRAIRQTTPDLIHAHFGWEGYFSLSLKRVFRIPLITRFYGYDIGILPRVPLWQKRYRRLFEEGDIFIVEGQAMKRSLYQIGCPAEKIIIHHLGVELNRLIYHPRPVNHTSLKVLMAATFKEKKGYEYGLRALRKVKAELPHLDISVRIIGDGPLREEIRRMAAELDLDSAIEWCGYRQPDFFYQALYDADIFLAPSVTASNGDTEGGAPVAIIEASASGLPVVSTTHADIPEVVIDGVTGVLAPERDVEALAHGIRQLAENPEGRAILGMRAANHIAANYDVQKQGEKLSEIYDHVINWDL
jgi:colanic acid/amylovoran biosynthesis glycosyltransferase